MGASGWSYKVAYQPDVAAALEALRRQVFDDGRYYPRTVRRRYARAVGLTPVASKPGSIAELLRLQAEEGTHSILDISSGVSAEPSSRTASPLTDDQHRELFGTLTPSAKQVEGWLAAGGYADVRRRWSAVYVVSYRGAEPHRIHFAGFSGD